MASIVKRPNSNWWIQYLDSNNKRQTLRLGRVAKRSADSIKVKVEKLIEARQSGCAIDSATASWLANDATDTLHVRLVRLGLAKARKRDQEASPTIGEFTRAFIDERKGTRKPNTVIHYERVRGDVVNYFGGNRRMMDVTRADADRFRESLAERSLALNTINRRMGRCKQFWNAAIDAKLITENPFKGQDCQVRPVEARFEYVEQSVIDKVLDACIDDEWRLIIAITRYAGMRCPSEVLALKWTDVNWAEHKMLVVSSKLEHHHDGGRRWVPIFAALRPYLEMAFEQAEEGSEYVITRYRSPNCNLRTQLSRICKAAGVDMWVKPFQNLRSSAEIDLNREFPQHVVARWLGHSENVALKHYLRTTDDDFLRAAGVPHQAGEKGEAVGRSTQAKQHAAAPNRTKSPAQQKTPTATGVTLIDATQCEMMQTKQVPPQGLEQLPFSSWNRDISDQGVVGGDITHFVEAQLYMRIVKSRIGFYLVGALTPSILSAV